MCALVLTGREAQHPFLAVGSAIHIGYCYFLLLLLMFVYFCTLKIEICFRYHNKIYKYYVLAFFSIFGLVAVYLLCTFDRLPQILCG